METLDHKMEPGKLNLGQALEEGMPWALKEEVPQAINLEGMLRGQLGKSTSADAQH